MDNDKVSKHILGLAKKRVVRLRRYSKLQWAMDVWFTIISLVASLCVPFGLAALLYIDTEQHQKLNIVLLCISAVGVVLGVLTYVLRIKYRAMHLRKQYVTLENAIAEYQDGIISQDEFRELFKRVSDGFIDEE